MIIYVMGVAGSGKTTIGTKLAEVLNCSFFDGDDFHPIENINKMSSGKPLDDIDRKDWLIAINKKALEVSSDSKSAVIACSALKNSYRETLEKGIENVRWVFLGGDYDLINSRLGKRENHFMPPGLLRSQFETLEIPDSSIQVNLNDSPSKIISFILETLNKSEFGLVGLGVMGKSLARNLANNGVKLSLYNRYVKNKEENVAKEFVKEHIELVNAQGFEGLKEFVDSMATPRKIFLMIKAGKETDVFIDEIKPLLEKGDILIDGGNSHFNDTKSRIERLMAEGIHFIGTGVSGGERGALEGPSIMPSGNLEAYKKIKPYFEKIAAKDKNSLPCCSYIGKDGSGHYIKMVHNGIEYAEMQLLAEVYALLRYSQNLSLEEISGIFSDWNKTEISSYLLEITSNILKKKEGEDYIIDKILDVAGNKGTGNWTTINASELGMPATMISSALFARYLSTLKEQYIPIANGNDLKPEALSIGQIKNAYQLARIVNHQQGFKLILEASESYGWDLDLSEIARIWTNGCIIRSTLMEKLSTSFKKEKDIFKSDDFVSQVFEFKNDLKAVAKILISSDIPAPCFLSAIDYLNNLAKRVPTANIIQAQRDFFGAHTYQRIDDSTKGFHHTIWE